MCNNHNEVEYIHFDYTCGGDGDSGLLGRFVDKLNKVSDTFVVGALAVVVVVLMWAFFTILALI